MKNKVILITGGSSGIGFDTAGTLAKQGHTVYAAARRVSLMEPLLDLGVHILAMDVTDKESIEKGVRTVLEEQGRIDVLINNAGYGYLGAIENVPIEDARRQLEVNLFGLAALTKLVLPSMRANGGGRIINISSMAGKAVVSFGGWYNISKFAVEAFSDALRIEVKNFGIDVVLIEPGGIKTDWGIIAADHLTESSAGTVYEKAAEKEAALFRYAYTSNVLSKPSAVTSSISKAVNSRRPRLRYRPGLGSGFIMVMHSILPARWWDALNRYFFKS